MDALTGLLLKLGGTDAAALALATFRALGLLIVNAVFYLCRASGLPAGAALAVATAFSLLPQSIYFEHLYLYEYPVTALLSMAAVAFHVAVRRQGFWSWLAFFLACSAIGLTRSTFHLVWFAAMIALSLSFTERPVRARVLRAAALPALLLLTLYVKNLALFGTFDAFTFGPASQTLVTVWHLPPQTRDAWIQQGRLSPYAAVSVYAGPREYLGLVGAGEQPGWPRQLTELERPSIDAPNYNHWLFLDVNRARRADALRYVAERPLAYAATVVTGLRDLFTASTTWHPLDASGGSPHERHRQVLGRYETVFNRIIHGVPAAPVGVYVFLPVVMVWTALRARPLLRARGPEARALGALLVFCLFQIVFVVGASTLFTFRESARYRFQAEPMIWVVTAACLRGAWRRKDAETSV
jgi:4-amino-4-deoxy-L-arabinose transferase-like glycosyltransferase